MSKCSQVFHLSLLSVSRLLILKTEIVMPGYLLFLASILYGLIAMAPTHSYRSDTPGVTYNYDRISEVKKKCDSVLSSASEFILDSKKIYDIKEELLFTNGDWGQEEGVNPLLPFDARNIDNSSSPSKLVSFWVADVRNDPQSKKSASINAFMVLSMSVGGVFLDKSFAAHPQFQSWPGHSELSIFFQGIYTESDSHGGEKVMCLLGNTLLPSPAKNSGSDQTQASLLEDGQILLVLQYPMEFALTHREIRGKMTSLNPKSNLKYFDQVIISSQLSKAEYYNFGSQNIVSKACDPYPYRDKSLGNISSTYHGPAFCEILDEITLGQQFSVLPNLKCHISDDVCRKMGPYQSTKHINETDGGFKDFKLSMQNVKCEQVSSPGSEVSARVSAVFRAISPSENVYSAERRSGLSNMSLAAEGIWKSSNGQLCMVGCLGLADEEGNGCNSRICMYISTYFSIKQRSIIFGTISAMDKVQSSFPLSFEKLVQPSRLWNYFQNSRPYYKYTKYNAAVQVAEKDQSFSLVAVIKKSLLEFPKLEDAVGYENSVYQLSEDLTLHVSAVPDPKPDPYTIPSYVNLEIFSVGPLFVRHGWLNSSSEKESPYHLKAESTEKQLLLNVSAQYSLIGRDSSNLSSLFLEGIYDPHVGKMSLIGCRDIRASWKILSQSMDLEDGLDCRIEVIVSYPTTTARWLVTPRPSISITSQRNQDDPLHFSAVKLQTLPITYRKQREDIISRRNMEGILQILTLSLAIASISSQILYTRYNVDSVPYISLAMLGVQALGYSLPLVTGAEALFKREASESYRMSSYDLDSGLWYRLIDYFVKLQLVVSLVLTLRLGQKVWKSRIRLVARATVEACRVPSDKWVLIATFLTHLIGYMLAIYVHGLMSIRRLFQVRSYSNSRRMQGWEREVEAYMGLVQDLFLFPQVIGNLLWQIDGKPLRKLYFIGITLVRLAPHFYDYLRPPSFNPYHSIDYEFVDRRLDYFSKLGDIAIPVMAFVLAVLVYIQQKWSYGRLSRSLSLGRFRLLPMASKAYERLASMPVEAELTSGVNGRSATRHGDNY